MHFTHFEILSYKSIEAKPLSLLGSHFNVLYRMRQYNGCSRDFSTNVPSISNLRIRSVKRLTNPPRGQ